MIESPTNRPVAADPGVKETTMLKKMSAALLAVSILAAPAFAAGAPKTVAADSAQTSPAQITTGIAKSDAGKPHLRKMARHHHRMKLRSVAHRHHNKVSRMHASVTRHGMTKTRLGVAMTNHVRKAGHTVSFNKTMKKAGPKLSFKRVTPATRRG
jgi:hypothetical protein